MTTTPITNGQRAHDLAKRLGPAWMPQIDAGRRSGMTFWAQIKLPTGGTIRVTQNSAGMHFADIQAASTRVTASAATAHDALHIAKTHLSTRVARLQVALKNVEAII